MIEITFELENQLLKRTDNETIINKSKDIVKAEFTFQGEIWENIDKFAIFSDAWDNKTTLHLGKETICSVMVPSSCLKGSFFKVSIYGGDLVTTNNVTLPLMNSGYTRKHHNHCHDDSKDIFVEIFEKLDSKIDNIVYGDSCLHIFSDGILIDSICLPIVDEAQIISMITEQMQDYTKTSELNDFLKDNGYINHVYFDGDEIVFE